MYKKEAVVKDKTGLHARRVTIIAKAAGSFKSNITIEYNGRIIDAESIMGLLAAAIGENSKVTVCAEGEDENEAVCKISELVESVD